MAVLLRSLTLLLVAGSCIGQIANLGWWKDSIIYQIYPRSFKDSNGDGIGDLKGITSKLGHFLDAGIGVIWLSPIYTSPMVDFGYDISNFKDVDPDFGTLADFVELTSTAKGMGIKVVLDFVPNHSSDQHPWFEKSINKEDPYTDYFIWKDPVIDAVGNRNPPNNWLSVFSGSGWTWNEVRQQYYYHQFTKEQPDLNYYSADVWSEMRDVLRFWLDKGVEGFRVDAVPHLVEMRNLTDEPLSGNTNVSPNEYGYLDHIYTKDHPLTYEIIQDWRNVLDNYAQRTGTEEKIMMTEAYTNIPNTMRYYESGAQVPFNFQFIMDISSSSTAADFKTAVTTWLDNMPEGRIANWVMGNHDRTRVATRFPGRADQMTMLAMVLPGIAVTYNGEEIGMIDTPVSWEDTQDPQACAYTPETYAVHSRDPNRSPFQWDSTTSAGFSTNAKTWLPVNANYQTLNLANQQTTEGSHYKVYQALTKLRKEPALERGTCDVKVIGTSETALLVARESSEDEGVSKVLLVINFDDTKEQQLDLVAAGVKDTKQLKVYTSSVDSTLAPGTEFDPDKVVIPASASLVLIPSSAFVHSLSYVTLAMALAAALRQHFA